MKYIVEINLRTVGKTYALVKDYEEFINTIFLSEVKYAEDTFKIIMKKVNSPRQFEWKLTQTNLLAHISVYTALTEAEAEDLYNKIAGSNKPCPFYEEWNKDDRFTVAWNCLPGIQNIELIGNSIIHPDGKGIPYHPVFTI